MIEAIEKRDTVSPEEIDADTVSETSRQLGALLSTHKTGKDFTATIDGQECLIPVVALRMLKDIMVQLSLGNAVTLMPIHAELTTQEAAELLNVSRPYVVKLLKEAKLPFRKVGSHRRILLKDLMAFKKHQEQQRLNVLEALAAEAQELGLGY